MPDTDTTDVASGGTRRVLLVCAAVGLLVILIRLALLPVLAIPSPIAEDEFSYILGADTFAHGRITNPPHPLWIHFETLHENMQPTYCSIYPPAQALFLAFGQVVFGHPWYGVLLSVGFMFAAICWMLHGWVSPRFALVTTGFSVLGWAFTSYWTNSYWGGAVAAGAGALLIGALPRIARRPGPGLVLTASIGLIILANSRPFEGGLTTIACAFVLWREMRRAGRPLRSLFTPRIFAPFLAIMIPGFALVAYYNYRTTGNALLFAHVLNGRMYQSAPYFYMFPRGPAPVYHHEQMRRYWMEWALNQYDLARANPAAAIRISFLWVKAFYYYVPIVLGMLAGVLFAARSHTVRFAAAIAALPILGMMCGVRALSHYFAPAFGALLIIAGAGLQTIGRWTFKGRPTGALLLAVLCSIAVVDCVGQAMAIRAQAGQPANSLSFRPTIIGRQRQMGGKHLIIVRYTPKHSIHEEWVYNDADIDGSAIVWAQDMGPERNRELLDYYRDRKIWLIQPDTDPLVIEPYSTNQ